MHSLLMFHMMEGVVKILSCIWNVRVSRMFVGEVSKCEVVIDMK